MITSPRTQLYTNDLDLSGQWISSQHPRFTYRGTFPSDRALALLQDQTRPPPRRPWGLVFNTDPSGQPGQHWIALYAPATSPTRIEIMDSYGSKTLKRLHARHPYIGPMLKHRVSVPPMRQLQSLNTYVCGHYCLTYLYARAKGQSLARFVQTFHPRRHRQNDQLVYAFARQKLKVRRRQRGGSQGCVRGCDCISC